MVCKENSLYNTERGTEGCGGERNLKLGTDSARVSMGTSDLSIDGASLAAVNFASGAVDIGDALTKVPLSFGRRVDTLQLNDRGLG